MKPTKVLRNKYWKKYQISHIFEIWILCTYQYLQYFVLITLYRIEFFFNQKNIFKPWLQKNFNHDQYREGLQTNSLKYI